MRTVHMTPAVTVTATPTEGLASDLLVIPVFEDDAFGNDDALSRLTVGEYAAARSRGEFTGKPFEQLLVPLGAPWTARRALFIGAGRREAATTSLIRRISIVGSLVARQKRLATASIVWLWPESVPAERVVQAVTEGVVFANFDSSAHKTAGPGPVWLDRVDVQVPRVDDVLVGAGSRGRVIGECTNIARELANEPGNHLTPKQFAERAGTVARGASLTVERLDEADIVRLRMGLLLGVARGSSEPPCVVVLRHEPADAPRDVLLALVGKGITFDAGGISLKPADGMDRMKDDMSGGAAVLCAMAAISRLKLPVRCLGVIPLTENMPGGRALKPGDILDSAEGKSVEVLNTDAEGRLILGDALWYARSQGATHLVDVATLTGACVVALGKSTSGLFGTPDTWVDHVRRASDRGGDRSWPMPVFDDYMDLLKSEIADFSNTGGRAGGAITAALFIRQFTGGLPWVHMDIAGTAWAEEAKAFQPKGATGVGVRTLVELAMARESWGNLK